MRCSANRMLPVELGSDYLPWLSHCKMPESGIDGTCRLTGFNLALLGRGGLGGRRVMCLISSPSIGVVDMETSANTGCIVYASIETN